MEANNEIKILSEVENKAPAFKEQGNLFFNQGNYEKAMACYNQAIEVDAKFKEAWLNKALCHEKLNQPQEALKALTQAIIIDPLYAKAVYNKANILIFMRYYERAIETLDRYLAQDGKAKEIISLRKDCANREITRLVGKKVPLNEKKLLGLGQQHEKLGELILAKNYFKAALILNPKSFDAQKALSRLVAETYNDPGQEIKPKSHTSKINLSQQLTAAIKSGNIAAIQAMIESGLNVNDLLTADKFPQYISHKTNESPNPFNMESLLGFKQAQPKFAESPLYLAARLGKLEVVDCLLRHNADVNQRENYGLTALIVAINDGYIQVALRLLEEPNIMVDLAVQDGSTALSFACEKNMKKVVEVLMTKGANIHHADKDGETPLIISIVHKHSDIAQLLLQKGANPNQCKPNGVSPLFLAAQSNQLSVLKKLIFLGAKLEAARDFDHMNALLIAAHTGNIDSVSYLLACGANQAATCIDHQSALDYAKTNNHSVLYKYLVDYQKKYSICSLENEKGINLFKKGDHQGALAVFQSLSRQYRALYQQKISVDLAACFYSIAECYRALGQIENATNYFREYYDVFLNLFGETNILTVQAKSKYDAFIKECLHGEEQVNDTLSSNNDTAILKPELINDLIYKPAIEFIKTAFGEKHNQSVTWAIYHAQNNIYAKANINFTFEKDAKLHVEKLHAIGLTKAFTKRAEKGWELIVPHLDQVLSDCKTSQKYSQSIQKQF